MDVGILKALINKHKVISFDIFDTLLLRPYAQPTDVFKHIGVLIKNGEIDGADKNDGEYFEKYRIKAEQDCRKETKEQSNNEIEDITLDEIYDYFAKNYGEKWRKYKQLEVDIETQTLQVNPEMVKIFDYAVSSGKQVIITSDMYLPVNTLENILKLKGYTGYSKLYVSSKTRKYKSTGNMFKYVINDLNIKPEEILHIGDNKVSDYEMPKGFGIDAYFAEKPFDKFLSYWEHEKFERIYYSNYTTDEDKVGASIYIGLLVLNWIKNQVSSDKPTDYWNDFGFNIGGVICYSYTKWTAEVAKKNGCSDIFFVARDGYNLKKIYDEFLTKKYGIKSHYVYANRLLSNIVNFDLSRLIKWQKLDFILYVLNTYSDIADDFYKSFGGKTNLDELNKKQLDDFFKKNEKIIADKFKEYKNEYKDYLSKIELDGDKIMVSDTATTSLSAQSLIQSFFDKKTIVGAYVASGNKKLLNRPDVNLFMSGGWRFIVWDIVECIMTSPESQVVAIKNGKPIYKDIDANEVRQKINLKISDGILSFCKLYREIFENYKITFSDKLFLNVINTYVLARNKNDEYYLSKLMFSESPSGRENTTILDRFHEQDVFFVKKFKILKMLLFGRFNFLAIDTSRPREFWLKLFHIPLLYFKITKRKIRIYLFKILPLLLICVEFNGFEIVERSFKLFEYIPFLRVKYVGEKYKFYLFKFIPILKIKYKNPYYKKYYLFGCIHLFDIVK